MKDGIDGLTSEKAQELQKIYGKNELISDKKKNFFFKILHILCEPMFLLLIIAATIYFLLGEPKDGIVMIVFVIGIISIDIIQEWKTDRTLHELKRLSTPYIRVIRDGIEKQILSTDLVPSDIMIISEGVKIPADGKVIKSSTLFINESSLTGETENVWKSNEEDNISNYFKANYCYAGTLVTQGTGVILVDKIGKETEYGKIGKNIEQAREELTPLQKQIRKLIKVNTVIAILLFLVVSVITFFNLSNEDLNYRIIHSILSGITLSMATIPEEFPVILTVFFSLGAWRLAKKQSLVKKISSVETLGAISLLCLDKTGTITMNEMKVDNLWSIDNNNEKLLMNMGMACKIDAYDPMEKAIIKHCEENELGKDIIFANELIKEYHFTDQHKIMGQVWKKDNKFIIVAKGSPENLLKICNIKEEVIDEKIKEMMGNGLRVIAVAEAIIDDENKIPDKLNECTLNFNGLISFIDPPRESLKNDIEICNNAGIRVIIITGDNGITASSIAKKVGIINSDDILTGIEIDNMSDEELKENVKYVNIYSRVIPEHKMRIIESLKKNKEVVAMVGDGVNDAPALKYSDIGIAMGKKGSEVSREAADLILLDDNFSTIVRTIEDGRRIYDNIKKAIGYVFTIHIPIIFISLIVPLLKILPQNSFLFPVHIMLLEFIIDPTCSLLLEKQNAESDIMNRLPRNVNESLLNRKDLFIRIFQGLVVSISAFTAYYMYLDQDPTVARTIGISIILISNILLVQVNGSDSIIKNMKNKSVMIANIITILVLAIIIYSPINEFLKFSPLNLSQILLVIVIAMISVLWYELLKVIRRKKENI